MQLSVIKSSMQGIKVHGVRRLLQAPDKKKEYITRKLIGFSSDDIYLVVVDVKHYKQFLPFCTKSTILTKKANGIQANLEIGFPPIMENYTSTVTFERPHFVRAVCTDGRLFNYLETMWKFSPGLCSNPKSCIIEFCIRFEFKSILYSQIASMFFDRLAKQMENAFIEEAKRRYGTASLESYVLSSPMKS